MNIKYESSCQSYPKPCILAKMLYHDQFTSFCFRYQKLKKGQATEDDSEGSLNTNIAAKYVILEETEEQEDVA